MCFFVQTNHTRKELLFLMFKEINLRNHSSLHKLFYSLKNHIKTIGSYFAEMDTYIGSDRSTYLYIPSFYISMLRNYVYDNFKDLDVTEKNSNSLFQKIRSFPTLHLNLSYEGIDEEQKCLNLTIRPFADVMEDEENSKLIRLEFEVIYSS